MNDSGRFADHLVLRLLETYVDGALPREPGRLMLDRIEQVLQAEGLTDEEHEQQVFARTLTRARRLLGQGERPVDIQRWLDFLAGQILGEYLCEHVETGSSWVVSLLEGDEALGGDPLAHQERVLARVREAIAALPAPYRQFLEYDLVERMPLDEVQAALRFAGRDEVVRFKKQAFAALRDAVLGAEATNRRPPRPEGNNGV